jgi:hypothetical protein
LSGNFERLIKPLDEICFHRGSPPFNGKFEFPKANKKEQNIKGTIKLHTKTTRSSIMQGCILILSLLLKDIFQRRWGKGCVGGGGV